MSWMQVLIAVPVALLIVVLIHDFMAGLGEERLWGLPVPDEEPILGAPAVEASRQPESPGAQAPVTVPLPPLLKKAV